MVLLFKYESMLLDNVYLKVWWHHATILVYFIFFYVYSTQDIHLFWVEIWTRACLAASRCTTNSAMPQTPNELRHTHQLSYTVPTELRRTLWATPHPLSYAAPSELRRTRWATPHQLSYASRWAMQHPCAELNPTRIIILSVFTVLGKFVLACCWIEEFERLFQQLALSPHWQED